MVLRYGSVLTVINSVDWFESDFSHPYFDLAFFKCFRFRFIFSILKSRFETNLNVWNLDQFWTFQIWIWFKCSNFGPEMTIPDSDHISHSNVSDLDKILNIPDFDPYLNVLDFGSHLNVSGLDWFKCSRFGADLNVPDFDLN